MRYLRSFVAMVAVVAVILTGPLQAALAAHSRCHCRAEPEAVPGDASAIATTQHDDCEPVDEGVECRPRPCDPERPTDAALWARLVNLRKKGKPKASLSAPDCPRRAPARIARFRPSPDGLLSFTPTTERCSLLCRFLL